MQSYLYSQANRLLIVAVWYSFQMEELHYSWHFHVNNDFSFLLNHLWWSTSTHDNGKSKIFSHMWNDSIYPFIIDIIFDCILTFISFPYLQTLLVQVKCFEEIISIGYQVYRIHGLPWFRSLSWYFLLTSNYFFYGENLVDYYGVVINRVEYLRFLVKYHRFLSFTLYCIGFVWFVLSLVKKYYMKQFSLFAWTHVALLIVVTQSYLIIQNIFEGK